VKRILQKVRWPCREFRGQKRRGNATIPVWKRMYRGGARKELFKSFGEEGEKMEQKLTFFHRKGPSGRREGLGEGEYWSPSPFKTWRHCSAWYGGVENISIT